VKPRRALLLFAIVLGVAAIASAIARTPDRERDRAAQSTTTTRDPSNTAAEPAPESPGPSTIEFRPGARPQTRELEVGQPATVLVAVETPAQVDIPSLGLTQPAEPLTPAVFELLVDEAGSHPITIQPAAPETLPSKAGTLEVVAEPTPEPRRQPAFKRSDRSAGGAGGGR
jgi:hypothetical protein